MGGNLYDITTLYIVRHGQTEENQQRILQGHLPGVLTEEGRRQVEQAAARLAEEEGRTAGGEGKRFRCVVCSDLQRAVDSARIIAGRLQLQVCPMELLRERDWGRFTGMAIAEAVERYRVDGRWMFPAGSVESDEALSGRATCVLETLGRTYAGDSLVVVTHGLFARHLVAAALGCSYREVTPFQNAEIRKLDIR